MTTGRSFAEYVKSKCYNGLYSAAESFVGDRSDELNLWSRKINNIGSIELLDADNPKSRMYKIALRMKLLSMLLWNLTLEIRREIH